MSHFRTDPFSIWAIFEVTHFQIDPFSEMTHFWSDPFSKWLIFEVTHFRSDSLSNWPIFEVTHFRRASFSKWPIFQVTHFRSDLFSKWSISDVKYFPKWTLSIYFWFFEVIVTGFKVQNQSFEFRVNTNWVDSWLGRAPQFNFVDQKLQKTQFAKLDYFLKRRKFVLPVI